jgi:hypothetical protein
LTHFTTGFGFFPVGGAQIISTWNLVSELGGYSVTGFGSVLHAGKFTILFPYIIYVLYNIIHLLIKYIGDTYGGAGFNVKNATSAQVQPYGSVCQC